MIDWGFDVSLHSVSVIGQRASENLLDKTLKEKERKKKSGRQETTEKRNLNDKQEQT